MEEWEEWDCASPKVRRRHNSYMSCQSNYVSDLFSSPFHTTVYIKCVPLFSELSSLHTRLHYTIPYTFHRTDLQPHDTRGDSDGGSNSKRSNDPPGDACHDIESLLRSNGRDDSFNGITGPVTGRRALGDGVRTRSVRSMTCVATSIPSLATSTPF